MNLGFSANSIAACACPTRANARFSSYSLKQKSHQQPLPAAKTVGFRWLLPFWPTPGVLLLLASGLCLGGPGLAGLVLLGHKPDRALGRWRCHRRMNTPHGPDLDWNQPQAALLRDSRPKQPIPSAKRSLCAITGIAFWPSRPDPVQPDHRLALDNRRHRHPHQRPRRRLAAKPSVCGGVLGSGQPVAVPARAGTTRRSGGSSARIRLRGGRGIRGH